MVFRGVTLHRADGSPVVATYATNVLWDALDKKRVHVLAEPYQPEGRSIAGEHMRVLELSLASGEQSTVTGFSRRMKLRGSFRKTTGAKGTKREGETFIELVADGRTFEVFGYQADLPLEEPLEIEARAVSLSPTSAHAGGPFVYVESTTKP